MTMLAAPVRRLTRRAGLALAGLALAGLALAASGLVAATAPAQAATVPVDGAVLYWDLNDESTSGAFAPGTWNLFSAGRLRDPGQSTTLAGGGATWANGEPAGWAARRGAVTVQDLQLGGGYAVADFAATRTDTLGRPADTAPTPVRGESRLAFGAGTGTLDPETGSASIAWQGDATVVHYSGLSFFYLADPELSITGGDGEVTATLGGFGSAMEDTSVWEALPETEVTLATFEGAIVTASGIQAAPDYLGVAYDTPADAIPQTAPGSSHHGSFPTSFVDFQQLVGTASYWYSSGGGADARKPTNPFTVSTTPQPVVATSSLRLSAPGVRHGSAATLTATVISSAATTGTVTFRSGSRTLGRAPVTDGRARLAVRGLTARQHPLTATYGGSATTGGSTATGRLTVDKATTTTAARLTRPTTRRAGRVTVTVSSPTIAPTGKVRVSLTRGGRTVRDTTATLRSRTAAVALPKGPKASYRVVVRYLGTANVAGSSRTASYRITR